VVTDPSRFRQLVMNLIGNAIKFTEEGGVQVVAWIAGISQRPQLAVEVRDTGIGIAPEHLESIFEPFMQADQSITRRFGGTGLGLAISRQIAERLGGTIAVQSRPGRGSTFTATIDIGSLAGVKLLEASEADLLQRKVHSSDQAPVTLPPASILLVDDGVTNRKLISLMLRRAGAQVATAENGLVALDMAARQPFDLILMDMQMPVLDGYSATRELRRRGARAPILALTAHSMKGDEERCLESGCSGYLTKPVECDRLLLTVAEFLKSSRESTAISAGGPVGRALVSTLPLEDAEFREIVDEFVDRLHEVLTKMRAATETADFEELAQSAHWLKGAGGTAGFAAFTEPARELEELARAHDAGAARAVVEELTALAGRVERPSLQTASAT
jgi:CheY-like chemotaxis protein